MIEAGHRPGWLQQAVFRFKSHWLLKMLGTTGAITTFMMVYFVLLRHPLFPVTTIPLTPLDRLIEFRPWSIVPYVSLWLYISLVPALLLVRRELAPYLSAVILLSLIGFAIFLFWPTVVPQPDVDWSLPPSVAFLKSMDASGNACPSMHVAFSVLTALWLRRLLKRMGAPIVLHGVNMGWCLLIVWSTLAIKQHLALDMEAGAALGLAVAVPHLYFLSEPDTDSGHPVPTTD